MYIPHFAYLFICQWTLGLLPHFSVNNVENMAVPISLQDPVFNSFGCTRSGIVGSYGKSIFQFLRNYHAVFHSSFTVLHSHEQCTRVLVYLHHCQHLLLLINVILKRLRLHHPDLNLHFLNSSDVEHLCMCLLTMCVLSLENCLFLSIFELNCFSYCHDLYIL